MDELKELRTRESKTYLVGHDDDGNEVREMKVAPGPIHYKDAGGVHEIRPEWRRTDDAWVLDHAPYVITVPHGQVAWTMTQDGNAITGTLLDPTPGAVPEPTIEYNRLWWLGVFADFDLCLIAFAEAAAVHSVLHSDRAPRRWSITYNHGPEMTVRPNRSWGRDNIESRVNRIKSDMHRELEVKFTVVKRGRTTTTHMEWTGRVKRVDPVTRHRTWSDDVVYPVRVR